MSSMSSQQQEDIRHNQVSSKSLSFQLTLLFIFSQFEFQIIFQEQSRDLHEMFHSQLERADDGFSLVADYFGRGVFNKLTVITDATVLDTKTSS